MTDSLNNEVLDILAKHTELGREKITLDTRLNTVGVESLMMVEIIYDLEERFDISIPDPDFIGEQQFKTAGDIVRAVKELIEEQQNTA
jgi:acyl carrier protein